MNNWRQHITLPNVVVLLFMIYFVILSEREMVVNTGPDPETIEFKNDLIEMRTKIQSMERADSIHLQNVIDYAKQIIENNDVVDHLDDRAVDSLFARLTNGG